MHSKFYNSRGIYFLRLFCYNDGSDTNRCLYGGTNYLLLMGEKFCLTVDQKQFKIEWNLRK